MPKKNPCQYAINARGKYNRHHICKPSCQWTGRDCIDWLNRTPYPTQTEPPVHTYTPPCQYGKPEYNHYVNAGQNGYLLGLQRQPCNGSDGPCLTQMRRHLPTCDCLDCVAAIRIAS